MSIKEVAEKMVTICMKYNLSYTDAVRLCDHITSMYWNIILSEDLEIKDGKN